MELSRLTGRKTSDLLLRKGTLWKGKHFIVRWMPGTPRNRGLDATKPAVYFGSFASAKLSKKAVERNRMRRRCREAFRLALQERPHPGAIQLLVCPRIASLESPFESLSDEARAFLTSLPAWPAPHPASSRPASSSSR